MQAISGDTPQANLAASSNTQVMISWEVLIYVAIFALAFLLRVAELDVVPMAQTEAQSSMSVLQVVAPHTAGIAAAPDSPLQFFLQGTLFSAMGASEFSARLSSVLGGMALLFMPLLFRLLLGREKTFILTVLLAASPVVFITTRQADSFIWTATLALGLVWTIWQAWQPPQMPKWAIGAAVIAAALALLSHSGGVILLLIMLLSAFIALWWTAYNAPEEQDIPGDELIASVRQWGKSLPLQSMIGIAALVVVAVSSVFMLYPAGLGHIGNLLASALNGFVQPVLPNMPFGTGFAALWVYELGFVVLAVASVVLMIRQGRLGFWQRFLVVWAILALLVGLLYRGSTPAFALWVVVPLAFLNADLIMRLFMDVPVSVYWTDGLLETDRSGERFWWVKYAIGVLIFAAFIVMTVHTQSIGRGLHSIPQGADLGAIFASLRDASMNNFRFSLLFFIITILFMVISLMLVASIWGNRTMFQSLGIGLTAFLIGTGIGGGWQASVVHASNSAEYWYSTATNPDSSLLRKTLFEVSQRETQGEPLLNIVAVRGGALAEDGIVGWLLRDYPNTRYVGSIAEAARSSIILTPDTDVSVLDLGGDYVGQRFAIQQPSTAYGISGIDWLAWVGQRRMRAGATTDFGVYLWLRQDVYNALPQDQRNQLGLN